LCDSEEKIQFLNPIFLSRKLKIVFIPLASWCFKILFLSYVQNIESGEKDSNKKKEKKNKPVGDAECAAHRWNARRSSARDATVNTPGAFKKSLFRSAERCWCVRSDLTGRGSHDYLHVAQAYHSRFRNARVRTQALILRSLSRAPRNRPRHRRLFGSCQLPPTQLPRLCSIPIPTTLRSSIVVVKKKHARRLENKRIVAIFRPLAATNHYHSIPLLYSQIINEL